MPYAAGIELDCRTFGAADWPVEGFVEDPINFPEVTAQAVATLGYRYLIIKYYLWERLPPGHRVICGVTIPAFSTTLADAQAAAARAGYSPPSETSSAVDLCNGVVEYVGAPWNA